MRGTGILLLMTAALLPCGFAWSETIDIYASAGEYAITSGVNGDKVAMTGYPNSGAPGAPALPARIYEAALPPDTDMASVKVTVSDLVEEELSGAYSIRPLPPAMTNPGVKQTVSWGTARDIKDGKDQSIYLSNAVYPAEAASLEATSQMRKWKFARVSFRPLRYNPVTGKLYLVRHAAIHISAPAGSRTALTAAERSRADALTTDTAMDKNAEGRFINFQQGSSWYAQAAKGVKSARAATYDYAIITTNAIQTASTKLPAFTSQLTGLGYKPLVVTETDYGSLTGQSPNGTAEKIRKWLIDNYAAMGIKYVLLIGDPTPVTGDIPMKMCWPRYDETTYRDSPTDAFYADLTGNWDLNGNSIFGEYNGDRGTGGVDFTPEVYVGRIPVYSADYTALDAILQKIITYKNVSGEPAWRKKALLPMAISNYANEDGGGDVRSDGLDLPKYAVEDFLQPRGFSHFVMYEKQGLLPVPGTAPYDNDAHTGVTETNMLNEWNNGYGVVLWWGHGSNTGVYRKYWSVDSLGNGVPQSADILWPAMFTSTDAGLLNDSYPSLVFQISCENGHPEDSSNLGYALLKNGAIATVAASRVSWYEPGVWDPSFASGGDNASTGYLYFSELLSTTTKTTAGMANSSIKSTSLGNGFGAPSWMNKMDFNLYGDPSITMFSGVTSALSPVMDSVSYGSMRASWKAVSGASYVVVLSTSPQFTTSVSGSSRTISGNTASFSGLDPLTTYWFEVKLSTESDSAFYFNRISAATTDSTRAEEARAYPIPWLRGSGGKFDSATVAGCGTGLIFDTLGPEAAIRIYNIQGDKVRELAVGPSDKGCAAWDGRNGAGREVASGIYLAFIESAGTSRTIKLVVER